MSTAPTLTKEKIIDLDFEVYREPWNKYGLKDGSFIRSRLILHRVMLKQLLKPDGTVEKASYGVETNVVNVVYNVPESLRLTASTATYTPEEVQKAVVQSDVGFDTLAQEWNEYIVEDGTKVRMQLTLFGVSRTSLADKNGYPIYVVQNGATSAILPKRK